MSSIVSQTWEAIEATNSAIRASKRAQKQGEARVAQDNSSVSRGTIGRVQQLEKDVIVPSELNEGEILTATGQPNGAPAKPQLPQPQFNWNAFQGIGGDQEGLIAIMGKVLALQAKTNSRFWSSLWKQASESMMIQVKMAPIMALAIKTAYQNQAAATKCQANQAFEDGMASMFSFLGAVVMGSIGEFNDENTPFKQGAGDVTMEDEGATQDVEDEEGTELDDLSADNAPSRTVDREMENADEIINKSGDETSFGDRAMKLWGKAKPALGKTQKTVANLLYKTQQSAALMTMFSQGITGLLVDSKYQSQKSTYEGLEGQAQALSKEVEQYAQYYGQDFSRTEDLRQGSSQNIDYAMNVLKGAADSITQSVTSMFRG